MYPSTVSRPKVVDSSGRMKKRVSDLSGLGLNSESTGADIRGIMAKQGASDHNHSILADNEYVAACKYRVDYQATGIIIRYDIIHLG